MWAILNRRLVIIRILLEYGADVESQNKVRDQMMLMMMMMMMMIINYHDGDDDDDDDDDDNNCY